MAAAAVLELDGFWPPLASVSMALRQCQPKLRRDPDFDALRAAITANLGVDDAHIATNCGHDLRRAARALLHRDMRAALRDVEAQEGGPRHG